MSQPTRKGPKPGSTWKQTNPKEPTRALEYLALEEAGLNHVEIAENYLVSKQTVNRAILNLRRKLKIVEPA